MGRKKAREEPENHERWLVSYADFITLLFAFFIVLYATSERNLEKTKEFQESIEKYLTKSGGVGGFLSGGAVATKQQVNQANEFNSPIEPPLPTFPTTNSRVANALESIEEMIEQRLSSQDVRKYIYEISATEYGVRVSLAATEVFAPGSARFQSSAVSIIDSIGEIIKELGFGVWVESYTSNQALPKGSYSSHWELAASRSTTMVRYLAQRHSFSSSQMAALSYGSERPLVPNDSEAHRRRNERLDILILSEGAPL